MSTVSRSTFDQVMVPNYAPAAVIPVRGRGSRLWDQNDREYVDLAGGIAVTSLGHAHPKLVAALTEQAGKLWHLSNVMTNEPALQLAQRLTSLTFAERVYLCNSGAEANEAAFKLVRRWGSTLFGAHKHTIVAFDNAFHGRTLFTVSVGGQAKYTQGFEPLPGGIVHVPFNDLAALEAVMNDGVCAVVMEPIQGEGGVTPATQEFARGVRALCDKHQALLVYDEVQTGNGRTGKLFAYEHYGVTPDVLTTAKGMGGGFPVGAMLTTAKIAEALAFGTHGSTYGGNPLAGAVADAVLEEISKPELLANVEARSQQLRAGLEVLAQRHGLFGAPRGMGLLLGAPLVESWNGRAKDIVNAGLAEGLWMLVAGPNVLRFAPALNITEADVVEGLARLDRACAALARQG
ncbi:aspartate aminotransferase family protein [Sinimarinibacterium sp. CAU 1509]|uniref:aspartate aminotransferase family protein n=1 Tax=Sinimarinibacterium sp. CAU 1509 TaxID=2562283 RepID=UPI0010AC1BCD|nr:aspartate aminotransferase family protein [Sinimarinibacterium sp. CAU 1509]TJY62914.1 aspartate aminotransferase family protein [Sinimarinibacterium sp. CAU 1509]